jgi:hypothetical protein
MLVAVVAVEIAALALALPLEVLAAAVLGQMLETALLEQ